ncbi:hypothetical protein DU508_19245 [Pedobacter chinensis]|uniref:Uncharacterized protein n=1 Tax=Pedobacter chinensis TaxID=2282421 RepID=A0A369PW72_9SPHI|nr:hypothetical protein [Pedobacter chinensis]RDC54946.1 hypothetical protein DU508_19245 [Pedobacter chinensis]
MKTNDYEYLLSKIYHNGVLSKAGLNADLYLKMQQEYNNLKVLETENGAFDGDYAFRKSFLIVRNYVQQAIKDGLKSFQFSMQATDIDKLSYMIAMLNRNFFDKKSLDKIISTASSVFNQYNLKN